MWLQSPHIDEFQIPRVFYILVLIRPTFYDVPVRYDIRRFGETRFGLNVDNVLEKRDFALMWTTFWRKEIWP